MRFALTINCKNAAFSDPDGEGAPGPEIATILRRAAELAEEGGTSGVLFDSNGNRVGDYTLAGMANHE